MFLKKHIIKQHFADRCQEIGWTLGNSGHIKMASITLGVKCLSWAIGREIAPATYCAIMCVRASVSLYNIDEHNIC